MSNTTNPMDLLAKAKEQQAAMKQAETPKEQLEPSKEPEAGANDASDDPGKKVKTEAYRFPSAPTTFCYMDNKVAKKVTYPEGVATITEDTPHALAKALRDAFEVGNCIIHSPKIPLETRQKHPGSIHTQEGVRVGK